MGASARRAASVIFAALFIGGAAGYLLTIFAQALPAQPAAASKGSKASSPAVGTKEGANDRAG